MREAHAVYSSQSLPAGSSIADAVRAARDDYERRMRAITPEIEALRVANSTLRAEAKIAQQGDGMCVCVIVCVFVCVRCVLWGWGF